MIEVKEIKSLIPYHESFFRGRLAYLETGMVGKISVKRVSEAECRHHWLIDSNDVGVCKYCGQKKDFRSLGQPARKTVRKKAPSEIKRKRVNNPWGRKGKPKNG